MHLRRSSFSYCQWRLKKRPKVLNSPEGNVAQNTTESVKLIESGVSRLIKLTEKDDFGKADLQSCKKLDVDHSHATAI